MNIFKPSKILGEQEETNDRHGRAIQALTQGTGVYPVKCTKPHYGIEGGGEPIPLALRIKALCEYLGVTIVEEAPGKIVVKKTEEKP